MICPTFDCISYILIAITLIISSYCVGIGQGTTTTALLRATDTQPSAHQHLQFLFIIGTAMLEFINILGCLIAVLFIMKTTHAPAILLSQTGAMFAFVVPAGLVGILSAAPLQEIFASLARQPLFSQGLLNQLLLTQIMLQTSVLFGFVISVILIVQAPQTIMEGIKLFSSGLVFGLGTIGPVIGLSLFARSACAALGRNRDAFDKIFSFTFVSQGMIETPLLLVFVIAIIFLLIPASSASYASIAYVAAALCMSITTMNAGINSGYASSKACEQISTHLEAYENISTTSLISQTFIESNAIYGLITVIFILWSLP